LAPPAPVRRFPKPLNATPLGDLNLGRISKEQALAHIAQVGNRISGGVSISAPAPPATTSQNLDLTTTPRPPNVGISTLAREIHPMWSWDQQSIYFSSNNIDPVANYGVSAPPGNAPFHVYRMSSDGAFIAQMTGTAIPGEPAGNQFYPTVNHSLTKLAYTHRNSPADPFQVYVVDFRTGAREQLTGIPVPNSPIDSSQLVSVEHPTWAPGDGLIAFAARNGTITNDPLNIYVVDVVTKVVRRLTSATTASGVECKDPIFHPDANVVRVTFSANTGNPTLGPAINGATGDLVYRSNPLRDLRGDGSANDVEHNLFSIPLAGATPGNPVVQLTTDIADDVEPTYNQSVYPPTPTGTSTGAYNNFLAFSSLGRANGNTYDIYFSNGNAEVPVSNVPIRLFTADTNAGAVPLNGSDERYPAWSSSLPPQNPIDRIAYSSNRQNNPLDLPRPTVSATDTDIWASEVTDITPPTLFWLNEELGEVMHIANAPLPNPGRRLGAPGDPFYFYATVKDLQYGVESVWVQIKDPDGPSIDAQSQNHKLFGAGQFPGVTALALDPANNVYPVRWTGPNPLVRTHYLHIPFETDYEGIGVSDYQYYSTPRRFDYGTGIANAQFASFSAGVDDSVRWSGNQMSPFWRSGASGSPYNPAPIVNRPPLDVNGNHRWLRLHDDGNFPDLVAGDDTYSASWVSPVDASDFYVDLICYDKAFNPRNPLEQQNWIIYDNIWGFSTQRFISKNPVLYVDDNGAGQKWPRGLKGSFRAFPSFRYGTESDILDRESSFYPREVVSTRDANGNRIGPHTLRDVTNAGGGGTLFDFLAGPTMGTDFIGWARGSLQAYRYDNWRILAKGPVTETVLNNYVPTRDEQPLDITGSQTIQRPVPRRAVVWNAPYTGDIFSGIGSILDQATQTLLATYQSRAGRLVVAGGDLMWALTGGNAGNQHPFHQNILGATYVSDEGTPDGSDPDFQPFQSNALSLNITQDVFRSFAALGGAPPWYRPLYHPDPIGTTTFWPSFGTNTAAPPQYFGNHPWGSAVDGTPFQTQDNLAPQAGWSPVFSNRMVVREDTTVDSKTVFMSFSLASLGRRFGAESDTAFLDCLNYRSKIAHATFCWMFSADLVGQVTNVNGGAPVSGAWVRALQGNTVVGSAFTRADGTYTIRGLPVGAWGINVTNPGFLAFNKADAASSHGLGQQQVDVLLSPAAPGSISGRAYDQANQPVPGAKVHATLQASVLYTGIRDFFATTGPDGTYIIPSAPVGSYLVTLDQPLPTGFTAFTPQFTSPVVVNQSQSTTGIDFELTGGAGDLTINVFRQQPDGTKGAALPAADVSLLDGTGVLIPGMTGVTDANGSVTFTAVPAGPTTISAFRFGFQENSRVVSVPQQQTPVEILLATATPQFVYGRATRAADNAELGPNDLIPPVSLQLLRRVSQLPIGSSADVFSPALLVPQRHNYSFSTFEGSYSVALRNHPRFFDASVDVVVTAAAPSFAPVLQLQGRPGTLSGTVREDNAGAPGSPIAGVTVQISTQANPATILETVVTGVDGRWVSAQTYASDLYTIQIAKFGYSSQTLAGVFLAGDTDIGDTLLVKAPRGQLYGLARRAGDQVARPNVKVEFWTPAGSPFGQVKVTEVLSAATTTPAPDGGLQNYTVGATVPSSEFLPEGTYQVRVTGDPRFASFTGTATVIAGAATRFNVDLTPLGGVLTGLVREDIDTGPGVVAGPPVPGATVRVMVGASVVATLTTDANGQYQTSGLLAPTTYTISATAFGFRPGSTTVFVEGPTSPPATPDVLMEREPPSTVSGAITSRLNGSYIADVTVDLLPSTGSTTPVVSGLSTGTATGSPPANYRLTNVPAGTYIMRATKRGWKVAQTAPFTVNPGIDRLGVNLQLDPQYTFGQGLLLISLPDDFPGQDAASVLGVSSSTFKSAYWVPGRSDYAYYHLNHPEAKEFRLGKSMFVRFNSATAFTKAGASAPNVPFSIPVQAGWNMVGSVRRQRIEWLRVKVATPDGQLRNMQQAMNDGVVGNGLFSFVDQYFRADNMDPFVGYFMKANQDCTLIVPVDNSSVSVTPAERKRVARLPVPSLAQVAAEIEAAGMGPQGFASIQSGAVPAWAALSAPRLRPVNVVRPLRPQSTSNPFELWPWRPGLG